ncbi:MAG: DNA repair protein RadC [Clostridia bacterium]
MNTRLTIKDIPSMERPYEKMEKFGATVLSDAELLAIVIKTGNREETSVDLSRRILCSDPRGRGLAYLNTVSMTELRKITGVGRVKAIQMKALAELCGRMASSGSDSRGKDTVTSPEDVERIMMAKMRYLDREVFRILMLNTRNEVIREEDVSVGTLNETIVHPREVFKEALRESAASIVLVHNHPSGDPSPSGNDIQTTKRLQECSEIIGIRILDHIIVGNGKIFSFKQKGLM